ncbi:hypothetical protein IF1G_01821 [Cordyceps javanica]|uniref:Uncharacterized protein n=1 Tax=Cordyceps javanica TaxID=43265 RepID=A0A545W9Q3_9HYPO|nr:hypothetical protein IF1G_01821 [Cordyceps javanica]TQW10719.1 hypothetical protein IF2G_01661 [Cordyceps javanica]
MRVEDGSFKPRAGVNGASCAQQCQNPGVTSAGAGAGARNDGLELEQVNVVMVSLRWRRREGRSAGQVGVAMGWIAMGKLLTDLGKNGQSCGRSNTNRESSELQVKRSRGCGRRITTEGRAWDTGTQGGQGNQEREVVKRAELPNLGYLGRARGARGIARKCARRCSGTAVGCG